MKTVAVIQARMGSTRLPGKVLRDLKNRKVLHWCYQAAKRATGVDEVWVATSELPADDEIVEWCNLVGFNVFRGSETDVLSRFVGTAEASEADIILRLTGDCPMLDPNVIGQVVALRKATNADYASNIDPPTWPDGLDVECFTRAALTAAHLEATRPSDRDCVTRYIARNKTRFPAVNLTCPIPGLHKERWVLDAEDDWSFLEAVAGRLKDWPGSYLDILAILDKHPDMRQINKNHVRNERFYEGISTEEITRRPNTTSRALLGIAETIIPLGAQTFSKSKLQYPEGSPLFASHGDGAYIYDVDGNDYVDLVSALLPNVLGYRDPDVDYAVRNQLDSGASLSLATALEADLATRLRTHIPCAEMVRFGKSGSDVTTAAVRLARHHTGREIIATSGYHGWHDWAVADDEMRGNGVPNVVGLLTFQAQYGEKEEARALLKTKQCACIIVEPETDPSYLKELRLLCDETGTVLIFDEVITGFRWSIGGAQAHFGIVPDLACFGKAMGNGMPISAIVGKEEIMRKMAPPDNIFYSGTFFGETLSLAAAIATIDKIQREMVIKHIWNTGHQLAGGILARLGETGAHRGISLAYPHPLLRLTYANDKIKNMFIKGMADNGVLIIASHNLTWAHREPQIKRILTAYDAVLPTIAEALKHEP